MNDLNEIEQKLFDLANNLTINDDVICDLDEATIYIFIDILMGTFREYPLNNLLNEDHYLVQVVFIYLLSNAFFSYLGEEESRNKRRHALGVAASAFAGANWELETERLAELWGIGQNSLLSFSNNLEITNDEIASLLAPGIRLYIEKDNTVDAFD